MSPVGWFGKWALVLAVLTPAAAVETIAAHKVMVWSRTRPSLLVASSLCCGFVGLLFPACRNSERSGVSHVPEGYQPARVAEIYFTTEVSGYVEPCGCTSEPLGGLPRLATLVSGGKAAHGLIDAGDLLLPTNGLEPVTREQHLAKARIIARAYRRLGAIALNVGPADISAGETLLTELQQEGAVPFVSANVRPSGEGGALIARSFVRVVGGIRIGLTGVATPEKVAAVAPSLTVLEHGPALRTEVLALRQAGAEVVIVLAHVGESGAMELAELVPEADLIIRAPGTPIERSVVAPKRVGPVIVAEAGSQGQYVGRITFRLGPDVHRPLVLDDAGAKQFRRRQLDQHKLKAWRLEREAWSIDPTKAAAVKAKDAQIARLAQKLAEPIPAPEPPSGPHVRIEILPLSRNIPEEPAVAGLLAGYYQKLAALNLEKGDRAACAPVGDRPAYVGTERCATCHEEAYAFWQKTKHAEAWATLKDGGKHYDLTCVGCHVVGYQKPGGFCRLKDVSGFENVGCENCHGPGGRHVEDEDPDSIILASTRATCATDCHVPEHSDAFVYETYLRQVTGPGHELSGD